MGRKPFSNKTTVEDCRSISTKWLKDHGYLNGYKYGEICWVESRRRSESRVGFYVSTRTGDEYVNFQYTITNGQNKEESFLDYKVTIVSTPCYFKGKRWWFICPLIIDNHPCKRRVGVLYLEGEKYFGCRRCHNLTYTSCKENHKYDKMFLKLGLTEKAAKQMLENGDIDLLMK